MPRPWLLSPFCTFSILGQEILETVPCTANIQDVIQGYESITLSDIKWSCWHGHPAIALQADDSPCKNISGVSFCLLADVKIISA